MVAGLDRLDLLGDEGADPFGQVGGPGRRCEVHPATLVGGSGACSVRPSCSLAALLLVGCSDDEPDADVRRPGPGRSVEQGIADLYAGDHATDQDTEAGACFAEELLDRAGVERLRDAGIITDSGEVAAELPAFDAETARLWVDAQFACVDYVEESTRALLAQTKGKLDQATYAACLRDALTEDQLRAAVEATLTGAWEAPEVTALATPRPTAGRRARGRRLGGDRHHDAGPVDRVGPGPGRAQQPRRRPAQERHRDDQAELPVVDLRHRRRTPAR